MQCISDKKSGKKTQIYICKKKRVINKKWKSIPKSFIVKKLDFKEDLLKSYSDEELRKYLEEQVKLAESEEDKSLNYIKN